MMRRKAAHGNAAIRRRRRMRYEEDFSLELDLEIGRLIRKRVYAKAREGGIKKLRAVGGKTDAGAYIKMSEMTVEQWLNTWLAEYCRDVKMRTLDKYRSTVKMHLIPSLGKVRLSALSKIQVQQACNRLGEGEKPLSAKSMELKNTPWNDVFHTSMVDGAKFSTQYEFPILQKSIYTTQQAIPFEKGF